MVNKNERLDYVLQWIEHHIQVGFGHIYMGLDMHGEAYGPYVARLDPYIRAGLLTVTEVQGQSGGHIQLLNYANSSFWMARVDIDEFVQSEDGDSVVLV